MKIPAMKLFLTIGATTLIATGCYTKREVVVEPAGAAPASEVVVVERPPAAVVETQGVAPSGEHVWIPGHWTRHGDRWVWTSGRWEGRPTPTAIYVPGHWEQRDSGFIWREGYWK